MQLFVVKSDAFNFLDLGRFTLTFTQIIELCTTHLTMTDQIHMVHTGGIDRESTFYADTIGHPANSKCFADTAVAFCNDCAFESLQTGRSLRICFASMERIISFILLCLLLF